MMGDKPSKFEEDAAAFAAGIFKVADNAKAAGKLKKLEEEVEKMEAAKRDLDEELGAPYHRAFPCCTDAP